jgi:hypothetical protein
MELIVKPFSRDVAAARFAVVVIIEVFALVMCFLPLIRPKDQWQKDCLRFGRVAAILALIVCVLDFAAYNLAPRSWDEASVSLFPEIGIVAIYILNVAILTLVIARTGGPTSSLYGTLIPIQLSAMLFLQFQKDRLIGKGSVGAAPFYYVLIAMVGYLAAYYLQRRVVSWTTLFTPDPNQVDYARLNAPWAASLTIVAMLLSFATYVAPSDEHFAAKIRSWYTVAPPTEHEEKK